MDAWRSARGPLLYAHRGACLEHPENTMPAMRAAAELGADALEIDVHMTRDRHVVVAHDPDVQRTAGLPAAIRDHDLAAVQRWDVSAAHRASHPHAAAPRAATIPTLAQVLAELPAIAVNVDIKQAEPSLVDAVVADVRAAGAESRVLLTSFSAAIVAAVRATGFAGPTGLGEADAFRAFFSPLRTLRARPLRGARLQIPTRHGPISLDTPRLIDKMHSLDLAVDYWVINDCAQARRLLDMGADGIVSDDPRTLAHLFATHPRTAGWRERHPELAANLGRRRGGRAP